MTIIVSNITCSCIISGVDSLHVDVYKELREYLSVRPSNYGMMLRQMARRGVRGWDGYTYFINAKGIFPTGFLPMVVSYLISLGIKVVVDDKRQNVPQWVGNDDLNYMMPQGEIAQHQKDAIFKTLNNYVGMHFMRGIWDMATNSRKTATAGSLIKNIDNPKAIMLVGEQGLLKQHYEYYKTVFTGKGEVGYITSQKQVFGSILTICMVRTLYNRLKKSVTMQRDLWNRFNILICDEVHDLSSKQATYVINHINAGIRVGMSGTPLSGSDKIARFRLIGMFGPVLHTVTKKEMMEKGFSLTPNIKIYYNPTTSKALTYDQEYAEIITESVERAELVADIICKYRKQKVLITFFERKHGQLMFDTFCERYPTLMHKTEWVHGEHKDRQGRVQRFIDNEVTILFSSTILKQGYNIQDIQVIIYGEGEMGAIAVSQWSGRAERLNNDETTFTLIDFMDNGKWCGKHSRKRLSLYKKEGFDSFIEYKYLHKRGVPITTKATL